MIVFETFGEQDGPQDAKTGNDGEKFRMSEPQRVRGTAVDSYCCDSRGNLVSNANMPPFIPRNLEKYKKSRVQEQALRHSLTVYVTQSAWGQYKYFSTTHPSIPSKLLSAARTTNTRTYPFT